jgi:hypothetical protein
MSEKKGFRPCCHEVENVALRAENLRMREALEYFVNIQAHIAGPESSLLACHARIARSALTPAAEDGQ